MMRTIKCFPSRLLCYQQRLNLIKISFKAKGNFDILAPFYLGDQVFWYLRVNSSFMVVIIKKIISESLSFMKHAKSKPQYLNLNMLILSVLQCTESRELLIHTFVRINLTIKIHYCLFTIQYFFRQKLFTQHCIQTLLQLVHHWENKQTHWGG